MRRVCLRALEVEEHCEGGKHHVMVLKILSSDDVVFLIVVGSTYVLKRAYKAVTIFEISIG